MDSRSLIVAALLATLFPRLPSQTDANNGVSVQQLIENACRRSQNYRSCLIILTQNPNTSSATSALSLAKIALQEVSNQSSITESFIGRIIKKHPKAAKPLRECASIFKGTIQQLVVGNDDWRAGVATLDINYALDSVGKCESYLEDAKVKIHGLAVKITKWKTLFDPAYGATSAAEGCRICV